MTCLFLLALASLGVLMKVIALLMPAAARKANWAFVFSPLLTPESVKRSLPLRAGSHWALRTALCGGALLLHRWMYWQLVLNFNLRGLSYLAAPAVLLVGELLVPIVALLWLPSGRLLPPLHNAPWLARGVGDFWGHRWNLWFSDWFRSAIYARLRRRPRLALILVFVVSGLMHEWVINLPLYLVTGRTLFGSMMLYFLLQAGGVLIEHRFLKRSSPARIAFAWLVVFAPVPLIINEGLLRALHLWPN